MFLFRLNKNFLKFIKRIDLKNHDSNKIIRYKTRRTRVCKLMSWDVQFSGKYGFLTF